MVRNAKPGELTSIPGIGKSLARDLELLGYRKVSDLRGRDPMEMYKRLCDITRSHQDRCVLYVFRCAVYFASETEHEPGLLKWWNWKDRVYPTEGKGK